MKEDLLKKYNLEEAQKRFQQICEYNILTGLNNGITEDDDIQQQDNQQSPMGNNVNGEMPQQNPISNTNGEMGQQMPSDNQQPKMNNRPMNEPSMEGQMGDVPPADTTNDSTKGEVPPMEEPLANNVDQMQPDDEVIDVDDLTQSQETTEYKIDGVNDKLSALMNVLPKFIDALNQNDEKLNDLKAEIEKRNPTAEEQMNIRSQASYPYSESPKGYWEEKLKENPNYDVIYNNDVAPSDEQKEFTLHKDDLNNFNDQDLAKSFEYPQELKDILKF